LQIFSLTYIASTNVWRKKLCCSCLELQLILILWKVRIMINKLFMLVALVTLPSICLADGPGSGTLTKNNVQIGRCNADSITVKWDLSSLMGEPTISGSYQWTSSSDCELPSSTTIWLQVVNGTMKGYVPLSPVTPKANSGFGYNTTGSPNWREALCGYRGSKAVNCYDERSAKHLWKVGAVNDFMLGWNAESATQVTPSPQRQVAAAPPAQAAPSSQRQVAEGVRPPQQVVNFSPIGNWQIVLDDTGDKASMLINADGSGFINGEYPLRWNRQGSRIHVTAWGEEENIRRNDPGQEYDLEINGAAMKGQQLPLRLGNTTFPGHPITVTRK